MTMEAKVRPWLLIVLLAVIIIAGGFTYWYVYADKGTTAIKTSPTPTKSAALSPTAGTTITPVSGKTSTPSGDQTAAPTPAIETKTFEGSIDPMHQASCIPTVTFKYPSDYTAEADINHSPTSLSYVWVGKEGKFSDKKLTLRPTSAVISQTTATCPNTDMNALVPNNVTATSSTINGYSALQWGTTTLIQNSDKTIVTIYYDPSLSDIYQMIVNSFQFK